MAKNMIPIDLQATLRPEPDNSFTVVVEISGIPTTQAATRVSNWLRQALHENVGLIGELDKSPMRQ